MDKRYLITLTPYQKDFRLIWVNDAVTSEDTLKNYFNKFIILKEARRKGILFVPGFELPYVWFKTREKAKEYIKLLPKKDNAKIVTINYKRLVTYKGERYCRWELS
jgi:hypothetical protein